MNDGGPTYKKHGIISLTIAAPGGGDNTAPTVGAITDLTFELGDTVNYAFPAISDIDGGDVLTVTHVADSSLTGCLVLNTGLSRFDITCANYDLQGAYTITLTATDDNSVGGVSGILSASQNFVLTLQTPNTKPEFYNFSPTIELVAPQTAFSVELFYKDYQAADTLVFLQTVVTPGLAGLLTSAVPTGDSVVGLEK